MSTFLNDAASELSREVPLIRPSADDLHGPRGRSRHRIAYMYYTPFNASLCVLVSCALYHRGLCSVQKRHCFHFVGLCGRDQLAAH